MGRGIILSPVPQPLHRVIGFDVSSDDYTTIAEVSFTPDGAMTIEKIQTLPPVVDLDRSEYGGATDGRSAGEPSGEE